MRHVTAMLRAEGNAHQVTGIGVVAALAVVALVVLYFSEHGSRGSAGTSAAREAAEARPIPPGVAVVVQALVSAQGRAVLTSELNALIGPGRLFPAGTTYTAVPGSWQQTGAYASMSQR
jgi:hypothetical protein